MAQEGPEQQVWHLVILPDVGRGSVVLLAPGGRAARMTQPEPAPQVFDGTDIEVDPTALDTDDEPASSDPKEMTDDGSMGGTGGEDAGGAG